MSTEILVNIGPQETRVALVEGGATQEIYVQRAQRHGLVGIIYKGTVVRVLPGMQAAFVDLGLDRTAFLHVADMVGADQNGAALPPVERLITQRFQGMENIPRAFDMAARVRDDEGKLVLKVMVDM